MKKLSRNAPDVNFAGYPATRLKPDAVCQLLPDTRYPDFFIHYLKKEAEKSKANFIWNKLHLFYDFN